MAVRLATLLLADAVEVTLAFATVPVPKQGEPVCVEQSEAFAMTAALRLFTVASSSVLALEGVYISTWFAPLLSEVTKV
jgi:hypothetical protein